MRTKSLLSVSMVIASAGGLAAYAADIGTAFTYQGLLENPPGTPVNDTCTFQFRLCAEDLPAPCLPGIFSFHPGISVSGGVFTVPDVNFFGTINGSTARWLEVYVDCPSIGGGLMMLSPRVELKPAPHALALPGLYTQQNGNSPNIIGGYRENNITDPAYGATISGGGGFAAPNRVTDANGTVGGGRGNRAGDDAGTAFDMLAATVAGGFFNTAGGKYSAVGGGTNNRASQEGSTAGGGTLNIASGLNSTVAGGDNNDAIGPDSAIGGGESNQAGGSHAHVGGGNVNSAAGTYANVGGGQSNLAGAAHSAVGGGQSNIATGAWSAVGGGRSNAVGGQYGAIAGGDDNTAGNLAFVGGGQVNIASGTNATIGGGGGNHATATFATVAGGWENKAGGEFSFASGQRAKVRDAATTGDADGDEGSFVWSDATTASPDFFATTGPNQFLIRAAGGVGINTDSPAASLDVAGTVRITGGPLGLEVDQLTHLKDIVQIEGATLINDLLRLSQTGPVGTFVSFENPGAIGSISYSAGVVSYNPFTGSHLAWSDEDLDFATLVRMTGQNRPNNDDAEDELVYGVEASGVPNDPKCLGSYLDIHPSEAPTSSTPHLVMAVGNGVMWAVDTGRNIDPGQYLISSDVTGHAMLDDPERFPIGYVIARAAEPVDWSTVAETTDGHKHKRISVFFESFERGNSAGVETLRKVVERQEGRIAELEASLRGQTKAAVGVVVALALVGFGGSILRRRNSNGGR